MRVCTEIGPPSPAETPGSHRRWFPGKDSIQSVWNKAGSLYEAAKQRVWDIHNRCRYSPSLVKRLQQAGLNPEKIGSLGAAVDRLSKHNDLCGQKSESGLYRRKDYGLARAVQKGREALYIHLKRHGGMSQLGTGGFGRVTKSLRVAGDAVELLAQKTQSGDAVPFALEEVSLLQELQSIPGVVRLHDYLRYKGKSGEDKVSILMEYCDGGALSADKLQHLSTVERWELFLKILKIAHSIHGKKICHLDYKADNILLKTVKGKWEPVIVDFGLACRFGAHPGYRGTTGYVAPELVMDAAKKIVAINAKLDNYSLGMLGLRIFAGKTALRELTASDDLHIRQTLKGLLDPDPRTRYSLPKAIALLSRYVRR